MDKILLKCITFLNPALAKMGVNTDQLHLILKIKLLMDNRRPKGLFGVKRTAKQMTEGEAEWLTIILTLLMGLLIGSVLFLNEAAYVGQTLYFLIFMVLMAFILISDFTTVLIDARDYHILQIGRAHV